MDPISRAPSSKKTENKGGGESDNERQTGETNLVGMLGFHMAHLVLKLSIIYFIVMCE
jgi:hypothetical protein